MKKYPFLLAALCACGADSLKALPDAPVAPEPSLPEQSLPEEAVCPEEVVSRSSVNAGSDTVRTFEGTVSGAQGNGEFRVISSAGESVFGPVPTDASGAYSVTLPLFCGTQQVRLAWTVADCSHVLLYDVTTSSCRPSEIRVTLTWDDLGADWELHLVKPGGRINDPASDCTWNTCVNTFPDWGTVGDTSDDPRKDVDDLDSFGPENIFLSSPEPGRYWVLVEHWSTYGDPTSDGSAQLNVGGDLTVVDIVDLSPWHVRRVATIDWPSGTVTPDSRVHDCSASWSLGCQDALP